MASSDVPPTTKPLGGSGKTSPGAIAVICISVLIGCAVLLFAIVMGNKQQVKADQIRAAETQQNVEHAAQVAADSIQEVSEQRQEDAAEPEAAPEPDKLELSAVTPNCKVYSFWQDNQYVYVIEGKDCHIAK